MSERPRSRIQTGKVCFFRSMAGCTRSYKGNSPGRNSVVEQQLLSRRCLLDYYLGRCSGLVPQGGGPREDPEEAGGTMSLCSIGRLWELHRVGESFLGEGSLLFPAKTAAPVIRPQISSKQFFWHSQFYCFFNN